MIDLSVARVVTGIGRNVLEQRIQEMCDEIENLRHELVVSAGISRQMFENLTHVQTRCTELLLELRGAWRGNL